MEVNLEHLRDHLTDVPTQTPPDCVFHADQSLKEAI